MKLQPARINQRDNRFYFQCVCVYEIQYTQISLWQPFRCNCVCSVACNNNIQHIENFSMKNVVIEVLIKKIYDKRVEYIRRKRRKRMKKRRTHFGR